MEKTYFNRLRELNNKFNPEERGVVTWEEIKLIKDVLGLYELKTELELRNMRDMAVMLGNLKINSIEKEQGDAGFDKVMDMMDKVSAVTAVIDNELWSRGYAV